MLASLIANLLTFIIKVFAVLIQFLLVMTLGLIASVLFALPWLLRMAALLLWLAGAYLGFTSIQTIYDPFSPSIPVIALQLAVILALVGWVLIVVRKNTDFVWGGLAVGGLVMSASSLGSIWLLVQWQYADLFFRALPPTLFSVLLLYETIRLRTLRHNVEPPALESAAV